MAPAIPALAPHQGPRWVADDFVVPVEAYADLDPWEPLRVRSVPAAVEAEITATERTTAGLSEGLLRATGDFWDPIGEGASDNDIAAGDWIGHGSLPDFRPHAAGNPYLYRPAAPTLEDKARQRARWLVALLDIPQQSRRLTYAGKFAELFATYSHSRTFATLSGLALDGIPADDLWSAFELKEVWAGSPQWWSIRSRRSRQPLTPGQGATMLGWTKACQFIAERKGLPPEAIIDPDWFNDWLDLSYGDPLYWRFLDYADARIEAFAAGTLEAPAPPRREIRLPPDMAIDGFSIFHNPSRTILLMEPRIVIRNAEGHTSAIDLP